MSRGAWMVLAIAAGAHVVHDGFSDVLYVLFPLWATSLGLSFTQVGLLKTAYSGGMALFQIPAGFLAERLGERRLLMAGTAVTAAAFLAVAAWVREFPSLLVLLLLGGLGSGVQHPLSSSLVSKAYEAGARRAALGTYNFAGDLGKIAVPAAVALAVTWSGGGAEAWRPATALLAVAGLAAAGLIGFLLSRARAGAAEPAPAPAAGAAGQADRAGNWGIRDGRAFGALAAIGVVDTATRTALLTFLPFVLTGKGLSVAGLGGALAMIFGGGALGKLVCGLLAERLGIIRTVVVTEAGTALGIGIVVLAPLPVALATLLPLGIALNGTSTVLYGTVAELVRPERRSRAYGLYYSLSVGASALAPTVYGLLGDAVGIPLVLVVVALVVLATLPLCRILRPAVEPGAAAALPAGSV